MIVKVGDAQPITDNQPPTTNHQYMFEKLEAIEKTYEDLNTQMTDNEIISDQTRYTKIARQHRELEAIVMKFREMKKLDSDISGNKEILRDMNDAEMRELAEMELPGLEA